MTPLSPRIVLAVATVAFATSFAPALAAAGCSNDAFIVSGSALTVEICAPAARPVGKSPVFAIATLTSRGQATLVRKVALDVISPSEASHTIDDAPLQSLGIAGTLHMTIGYKAGAVRLEHALLVPGAIALK
jgi:hypothetical protein